MAKRRRKSKPNLPDDVLARARKNAGLEAEPDTDDSSASSDDDNGDESASVVERAARRRKLSPVQLERSRQRGELSSELIQEALQNPTDIVSEDELNEEYKHVLFDLRNMAILAALLITVLIGVSFVLPTF